MATIAEHVIACLKAGHDVGNLYSVYVFKNVDQKWGVEVFDDGYCDEVPRKHLEENNFSHLGNIWHKNFDTPEEASACYLSVHAEFFKNDYCI